MSVVRPAPPAGALRGLTLSRSSDHSRRPATLRLPPGIKTAMRLAAAIAALALLGRTSSPCSRLPRNAPEKSFKPPLLSLVGRRECSRPDPHGKCRLWPGYGGLPRRDAFILAPPLRNMLGPWRSSRLAIAAPSVNVPPAPLLPGITSLVEMQKKLTEARVTKPVGDLAGIAPSLLRSSLPLRPPLVPTPKVLP